MIEYQSNGTGKVKLAEKDGGFAENFEKHQQQAFCDEKTTIKEKLNEHLGNFAVDTCQKHHFSDGLYAKEMFLQKGYMALSHSHNYSHLSILSKGCAKVETDDSSIIYEAPACIEIKAGVNHQITALEDVTWFCIHATNETDIEKIDQVLVCQD